MKVMQLQEMIDWPALHCRSLRTGVASALEEPCAGSQVSRGRLKCLSWPPCQHPHVMLQGASGRLLDTACSQAALLTALTASRTPQAPVRSDASRHVHNAAHVHSAGCTPLSWLTALSRCRAAGWRHLWCWSGAACQPSAACVPPSSSCCCPGLQNSWLLLLLLQPLLCLQAALGKQLSGGS